MVDTQEDFYVRYYVGHKGRFGHEFLEFELRGDGRLRYANNSQYKDESMIRKEEQCKNIIDKSDLKDANVSVWPKPDRVGKQELELKCSGMDLMISTCKIGAVAETDNTEDPSGLKDF